MMKRMSYDEWGQQLALTYGKPDYHRWMGSSPGGAAADLKVTRQRVWQMVKEGKLDMLLLADDDDAKVSAWLITEASIARLKMGKMSDQANLLFGKPRGTKAPVRKGLAHARTARRG